MFFKSFVFGVAILAASLLLLACNNDEKTVDDLAQTATIDAISTVDPTTAGTASATSTAEPIADVLLVITPVDPPSLVGRRVMLSDVNVLRVAGDRSFWIGPDDSQKILAVLGAGFSQPPLEEIVDVNKNQVRSFSGTIRQAPATAEATSQMKLKTNDAAALEKAGLYIDVDTVELVPRN